MNIDSLIGLNLIGMFVCGLGAGLVSPYLNNFIVNYYSVSGLIMCVIGLGLLLVKFSKLKNAADILKGIDVN